MDAQSIKGTWKADIQAWSEADPNMAAFGEMLDMMIGSTVVTIEDAKLTIAGYGGPREKTYDYTVREASGNQVIVDIVRGDGEKAVYELSFSDADHMIMKLTSPKSDIMALKRA